VPSSRSSHGRRHSTGPGPIGRASSFSSSSSSSLRTHLIGPAVSGSCRRLFAALLLLLVMVVLVVVVLPAPAGRLVQFVLHWRARIEINEPKFISISHSQYCSFAAAGR
jgi:hypothetical protein